MSAALENVSYGVSGESGDPAANPGPSGGAVPGPRVPSPMYVVCPSTLTVNAGVLGDGAGDGCVVCATAGATPDNAASALSKKECEIEARGFTRRR